MSIPGDWRRFYNYNNFLRKKKNQQTKMDGRQIIRRKKTRTCGRADGEIINHASYNFIL